MMRVGLVSAVLMLVGAGSSLAAEVRLRSAAACGTAVVRIADVAEVFATDARLVDALSDITLCPAPMPGNQKSLTQAQIQELLTQSGVDRKTVTVTGSETVTITAGGHAHATPGGKRPVIASGIRQATFEADVEANRPPAKRAALKPQPQPQSLNQDKQTVEPPVIERGAVVTVSVRAAGIKITTSGKALDDGSTGETISVELTDGKQRVLARVKGPQVVEVME